MPLWITPTFIPIWHLHHLQGPGQPSVFPLDSSSLFLSQYLFLNGADTALPHTSAIPDSGCEERSRSAGGVDDICSKHVIKAAPKRLIHWLTPAQINTACTHHPGHPPQHASPAHHRTHTSCACHSVCIQGRMAQNTLDPKTSAMVTSRSLHGITPLLISRTAWQTSNSWPILWERCLSSISEKVRGGGECPGKNCESPKYAATFYVSQCIKKIGCKLCPISENPLCLIQGHVL